MIHAGEHKKLLALLLLTALLVAPTAYLATASGQDNGVLPNINQAGIPNPLLNIGPGLPAIVTPGGTVTITLKSRYTTENITSAKILAIYLENGKLVEATADLPVARINESSYNLTIPSGVKGGLYDLILNTESGKTLVSARSIWVITSPSQFNGLLRFLHITDVHFGAGEPNPTIGDYKRAAGFLFSQLAGVDMILNTGDEADTAFSSQYLASLAYRYMLAYPIPEVLNPGNHDWPIKNFINYYEKDVAYTVIPGTLLIAYVDTGEDGYANWTQLQVLKSILEKYSDIPYKIVMIHHPVFYYQGEITFNSQENTSLLTNPHENSNSIVSYYWGENLTATRYFLKLCEDYNVTLVLAGHIHHDMYVKFHSSRTNTTTLFQTTTTLSQSSGMYQGFQVFTLNLTSGNISYPLSPPWFVGYKNQSVRDTFNSIPNTLPQYSRNWNQKIFDNTTYYGELIEGKKALILKLVNNLPYFDVNRTIILALPWPSGYQVNLKLLDSTGASAEIVDQLRVDELNRTFIALHINLPHNSVLKLALYTEEDNDAPQVEFKTILPKQPSVNKTVKLYVNVDDNSWGVSKVTANITASAGEVKVFKFTPYGGNTYLAQFQVISNVQANATITVTAEDFAGHTTTKSITITLAGPTPPTTTTQTTHSTTTTAPGTTSPTTQATTSQAQTTTPAAGGESSNTIQIIIAIIIVLVIIAIVALVVAR